MPPFSIDASSSCPLTIQGDINDGGLLQRQQEERPSQIKFVRAAQMSLFANVTCWPPLGQVTFLKRRVEGTETGAKDKLRFTVLVESSRSFVEQNWDVSIWHNINGDWEAISLLKRPSHSAPMEVGQIPMRSYHRHLFSQEVDFPAQGKCAAFTIRYRSDPESPWLWVNQQFGTKDGELVFQPQGQPLSKHPFKQEPSNLLGVFLNNLNPNPDIQFRISESPGATLWSITGEVRQASGGQSGVEDLTLGLPINFRRNFSLVRIWSPWLAPRHGMETFRLTEDALLCSFLHGDGLCLVLLAISGVDNVLTVFKTGDDGDLVISAKNDNTHKSKFQVLAAVSSSFDVSNAAVMYEARKIVGQYRQQTASADKGELGHPGSPLDHGVVFAENDPKVQWLAEWYDGLAYCTWNSLGQDLTEKNILDALDTMKANGIAISNLIIDDNWQSLDNKGQSQFKRGWTEFEANKEGFPAGLKNTVNKIRQAHPNIQHIAVWHALMGYWGGISPRGEIAKNYKTKIVKVDGIVGGTILAVDPDDVHEFYDDLYSFLSSAGVDSVKTDAQFFLDLLEDATDRARFATAYQDAWSISTLRRFQTKAISCMSQAPQIVFHSQLPTNRPRILLRNSDDFFPDVPTSHPWHIFCNAHNSLFTQHLNVIPDWDMFQTSHPYAHFHAAARCVSGGPVCITDEPGKHDSDLIKQMTAPTTGGHTTILRPSVTGRTIDAYHNYHEGHILKVGTYTGGARTGSGMLGLFNIDSRTVLSLVSILDFPGISPDSKGEYVLRAHRTGGITPIMRPTAPDSLVSVCLEQRGWEILTAYPVRAFKLAASREPNVSDCDGFTHITVLGLLGKMTGAAAILRSDISVVQNDRLRLDINLKALGTLGIYISDLETRSVAQNFMVMLSGKAVPTNTVWKGKGPEETKVLAIDVLTAWKEMGLDSGWSNEVVVQVFMS